MSMTAEEAAKLTASHIVETPKIDALIRQAALLGWSSTAIPKLLTLEVVSLKWRVFRVVPDGDLATVSWGKVED